MIKPNKPLPIQDIYILRNYDGGDGLHNTVSKMATYDKKVADAWCERQNGNDYIKFTSVMVNCVGDFEDVAFNIERAEALSKLTEREKKILGFDIYGNVATKFR